MSENEMVKELKKISKILILVNSNVIETELLKLARTAERKKMWTLIDGKRMPGDIAHDTGVTAQAVSNFLNSGINAGFIEYRKGAPPVRILDYVPPSWLEEFPPEEVI